MMELLPPAGWSDVARQRDLDRVEAKVDRLEARFDRLDAKIDHLVGWMLAFGAAQTAVIGLVVSLS